MENKYKLNKYKGYYYQYFSEGRYVILDCDLVNMGEARDIKESKEFIEDLIEIDKQTWEECWN